MMQTNKAEYTFSDAELKAIVRLFSKTTVPTGLEKLYQFATDYVYQHMTIAEAENLIVSH